MPNRNCFITNPGTGYYKLTDKMRGILKVITVPLGFICGDHFMEFCFEPNGRLKSTALPFPRKKCLDHDHTYTKGNFDL